MSKPKRLTFTFNRATVKAGEAFEVVMPSSEEGGLEWTLEDPTGRLQTVDSKAYPAWEPRARAITLKADTTGTINFSMALKKPGAERAKQAYRFKVLVK